MCFGCLDSGHMSKGCSQRLTCQVCSLKHPTVLHITNKAGTTTNKDREKSVTSWLMDVDKEAGLNDNNTEEVEPILAIVPVKVQNKKNNKTFSTYAFLDPGSTDCF